MTFSNKEREKQLSLLLIKMYTPVLNSSPYIRVTTQCTFPVLFVPSEAKYLSDSVLRISLFLVNPYICRDQWLSCYSALEILLSPLIWSQKREIVVICIDGWPWIWGQSHRKETKEEKDRDHQRRPHLLTACCT